MMRGASSQGRPAQCREGAASNDRVSGNRGAPMGQDRNAADRRKLRGPLGNRRQAWKGVTKDQKMTGTLNASLKGVKFQCRGE